MPDIGCHVVDKDGFEVVVGSTVVGSFKGFRTNVPINYTYCDRLSAFNVTCSINYNCIFCTRERINFHYSV
jgi:hypothetical protein